MSVLTSLALAQPPPAELADGACTHPQVDPEWFFPQRSDEPAVLRAKQVCQGCPVTRVCGQWATDTGQQGVWGGMTRRERAHHPEHSGRVRAPG